MHGTIQKIPETTSSKYKLEIQNLSAWFDSKKVLDGVNLKIPDSAVTAIIGPSGSGKTTLLRCLNRMHELVPGARVSGKVYFDGENIYANNVDPVKIRLRMGMVFQKPNPFPMMSVFDNVAAGLKLNGISDRKHVKASVEKSLKLAYLWDEVKDSLDKSGVSLSGGEQQRLCIARALAVGPEVLLLDEPCSSLDPLATAKIEELITNLKQHYTVVIVTHNMQQAARVSDFTAFMYLGRLIEFGPAKQIFSTPQNELTENYITGKFG